nr:MAG: hypothetical protein [Microvirus sp.]
MGKFPWGEILSQVLPIIMSYFAGRYRAVAKNKTRRKDDV